MASAGSAERAFRLCVCAFVHIATAALIHRMLKIELISESRLFFWVNFCAKIRLKFFLSYFGAEFFSPPFNPELVPPTRRATNQLSIKISLSLINAILVELFDPPFNRAPYNVNGLIVRFRSPLSLSLSLNSSALPRTSPSRLRTKMEQPPKEHSVSRRLQPNQDLGHRFVWSCNARSE